MPLFPCRRTTYFSVIFDKSFDEEGTLEFIKSSMIDDGDIEDESEFEPFERYVQDWLYRELADQSQAEYHDLLRHMQQATSPVFERVADLSMYPWRDLNVKWRSRLFDICFLEEDTYYHIGFRIRDDDDFDFAYNGLAEHNIKNAALRFFSNLEKIGYQFATKSWS